MNRESNTYTIIYASILVIVVAVALAFTAQSLKGRQETNAQVDKMQQILRSLNQDASDKGQVKEQYLELIKKELLVNSKGEVIKAFEDANRINNEAFRLNTANAYKLAEKNADEALTIYVAEVDGSTKYIIPLNGAGLWGALWGYLSLDSDGNTVFGSDFSHASETPGLGAEISTKHFSDQFVGKHIFADSELKSVAVVKPGQSLQGQDYVDGISGGTLTSVGVNNMLISSLAPFKEFLINNAKNN